LKMDLIASLKDRNGTAIVTNIMDMHLNQPTKNYQPVFEYTYKFDSRLDSAQMYLKFMTGWEHTYKLKDANQRDLFEQIETYNYIIEGIRNTQGHDDEFDEETRILRLGDQAARKFSRPAKPWW